MVDACRRAGFEPLIGQVAAQITSIANLVAVELGVSVVPAPMANAAVSGVRYLRIKGIAPVARSALATRMDDHSVITRNFRSLVQQAARQAGAAAGT